MYVCMYVYIYIYIYTYTDSMKCSQGGASGRVARQAGAQDTGQSLYKVGPVAHPEQQWFLS